MRNYFDVAIVGAGPAGSAAARRLALAGKSVVLIEKSGFDQPRPGESLAPAVRQLLQELDVWPAFLDLSPLPCHGIQSCWGGPEILAQSFLFTPWGCGWHVDRQSFDRMLCHAAERAGARLLLRTTARVDPADSEREGWLVDCGTTTIRAKVLVDATGRGADIGLSLRAHRRLLDHLVGISVELPGGDPSNQGFIGIEAFPDGWWYTAPLPRDRHVAVLMTDADLCNRGKLASTRIWADALARTELSAARLGGSHAAAAPKVCSSVSHRLVRSEQRRPWLAVGDAAIGLDPISGMGVVRALRSAETGAQSVLRMLREGTEGALADYEEACDRAFTDYLTERTRNYRMEMRWPDHRFWLRRHRADSLAEGKIR